jgi:hypothetical protein
MGDDGVTKVVSRRLPREDASAEEEAEAPRPFAGIAAGDGDQEDGGGLGEPAVERPLGSSSGSVEAA